MAKAAKGKFKCPKCDRTFSMPGHLGRHMSAIHGLKSKKKAAKKKAKRRKKVRRRRKVKRVGRPAGVAARLKLQKMTLEELGQLIIAARAEARRKMAALNKAFK